MNYVIWLMRAKRWASNPPSMKMVIFILAIVGIMIGLALWQNYVGFPDWMSAERARPPRFRSME